MIKGRETELREGVRGRTKHWTTYYFLFDELTGLLMLCDALPEVWMRGKGKGERKTAKM